MNQPGRKRLVHALLKAGAYGVHVLTATGVVAAFLAAVELLSAECDPRWVFLWLAVAVLIDSVDGPLARLMGVKYRATRIDGRTIDDIVDYLTFTFLPLLLIWRMEWVPEPRWVFVVPAMVASLLGFANVAAKQEGAGFFQGFPSYWNIAAFYCGIISTADLSWACGLLLLLLAVLTVSPVRFIYPNLARAPWKLPLLVGAFLWLMLLVAILPWYPLVPAPLVGLSLLYPAAYTLASFYLDVQDRRQRAGAQEVP